MRVALLAIAIVLAAFVGTSSAVTPQQTIKQLRSQLAAAKKANSKLDNQNNKLVGEYLTAKANLATAKSSIATMTVTTSAQATALSAAQAQVVTDQTTIGDLNAAVATSANGQAASMTDPQLWSLLSSVYQRMAALGGTAYSASVFSGSSLSSYDFDYFS